MWGGQGGRASAGRQTKKRIKRSAEYLKKKYEPFRIIPSKGYGTVTGQTRGTRLALAWKSEDLCTNCGQYAKAKITLNQKIPGTRKTEHLPQGHSNWCKKCNGGRNAGGRKWVAKALSR